MTAYFIGATIVLLALVAFTHKRRPGQILEIYRRPAPGQHTVATRAHRTGVIGAGEKLELRVATVTAISLLALAAVGNWVLPDVSHGIGAYRAGSVLGDAPITSAIVKLAFGLLTIGLLWGGAGQVRTSFDSWGIRQPWWFGNKAIPWHEVTLVRLKSAHLVTVLEVQAGNRLVLVPLEFFRDPGSFLGLIHSRVDARALTGLGI